MRPLSTAVLLLCIWCGNGVAGMVGDFFIPDSLAPAIQPGPAHNNRTAVVIAPQDGTKFALYLPVSGVDIRPWTPLKAIADHLANAGELVVYNLGGRPWFGARQPLENGVSFFDGYTHRDGKLYNVAFSMDNQAYPDTATIWCLSQISLFPGLGGSPALPDVARAINMMDTAELEDITAALNAAMAADPSNWVPPYMLARLAEGQEDLDNAQKYYQRAHELRPVSQEIAARLASMQSMTGDADAAVNRLFDMADSDPEEPTVWEELGRIYLSAEDLDTARDFFNEAIAANPASESALYNLSFIYAQQKDYENALRRSREFMHYYPWMPKGVVPDVTGAPELAGDKARQILAEPLPVGGIGVYAALAAPVPSQDQIQAYTDMISVPVDPAVQVQQVPVEVPVPYEVAVPYAVPVYEPVNVYAPTLIFDWGWSPRRYGYWRPGWNWDRWDRRPPRWRRPPRPHHDRPHGGWSGPGRPGNRPGGIGPDRGPSRRPVRGARMTDSSFRPPRPSSRDGGDSGRRITPPAPPRSGMAGPGGRRVNPSRDASRQRPGRTGSATSRPGVAGGGRTSLPRPSGDRNTPGGRIADRISGPQTEGRRQQPGDRAVGRTTRGTAIGGLSPITGGLSRRPATRDVQEPRQEGRRTTLPTPRVTRQTTPGTATRQPGPPAQPGQRAGERPGRTVDRSSRAAQAGVAATLPTTTRERPHASPASRPGGQAVQRPSQAGVPRQLPRPSQGSQRQLPKPPQQVQRQVEQQPRQVQHQPQQVQRQPQQVQRQPQQVQRQPQQVQRQPQQVQRQPQQVQRQPQQVQRQPQQVQRQPQQVQRQPQQVQRQPQQVQRQPQQQRRAQPQRQERAQPQQRSRSSAQLEEQHQQRRRR